ncbi:MAG: outer membrane protein assembly factor BamE domain-containing protein [Nitrospinales bacterium]
MKIVCSFIMVTIFVISLAGCGSVGRNFDSSNVQNIKNNVTTQGQIIEWFGEPFKKGQENGRTMWTYQYDKYSGSNTKSKDLVLLFDKSGKVIAYRHTSNMDE